jgi:LCP family protein required for cell wall assembly
MNPENDLHKPKRKSTGLILLALLAFAAAVVLLAWNNPLLGRRLPTADVRLFPSLPAPLATQVFLEALQPAPTTAPLPTVASLPTSTPAEAAAAQAAAKEPACGGPEQMLVLGLGIDLNAQSDVIRLMRIDFVEQQVRILSIPRDFVVMIPGFEQYKIDLGRISAAYGFGEYFNGEGKGNGVIATANTIYANYGVQPDRYVVVQRESAAKWVDRLGGVEMVLDKAVDGTAYGLPFFNAGEQHFDGKEAYEYFLIRSPDSDIDRINRQSLLLKALYAKAVSSLNVVQLTGLGVEAARDKSVQTDLSARELYALACLGKLMTEADMQFVEIPGEMYHYATTEGGGSVLVPHAEAARFIQEALGVSAP